jgi:hypothetical protein
MAIVDKAACGKEKQLYWTVRPVAIRKFLLNSSQQA